MSNDKLKLYRVNFIRRLGEHKVEVASRQLYARDVMHAIDIAEVIEGKERFKVIDAHLDAKEPIDLDVEF